MAVQQNRKSRSKRDKRRNTHASMNVPTLSIDQTTGETHRRHHVTRDGFYRGRRVVETGDDA